MASITCGIDPGLSGACAFLDERANRLVGVYDLPLCEGPNGQRELDSPAFGELLERHNPRLVVLEKVQGFGGVSSAFKLGQSYGGIIVRVLASRFRLERVTPQTWQASMFPATIKDSKDASVRRAMEIVHSDADFDAMYRGRSRKPDHNRADAINLARYGSKTWPEGVDVPAVDRTRKGGK